MQPRYSRSFGLTLCLILGSWLALGQSAPQPNRMRVSLITCGAGTQVWELFGHTSIRIVDSNRRTDIVYNYGMFDGFEEGFEVKFMRGKLRYYIGAYPYADFLPEYIATRRRVEEQVLDLSATEKQRCYELLEDNLLEINKYYQYDFFFDNCATRIRDIFKKAADSSFRYGNTIAGIRRITYRQIMNQYLYADHATRFGINLLLGTPTDRVMSNEDIMFLPDFLRDGVAGASIGKRRLAGMASLILPGQEPRTAGLNYVLMVTLLFLALLSYGIFKNPQLGMLLSRLLLFLTGFVGCFIILMWLGTDHQACQRNCNILWALPTNLFVAFTPFRRRATYALLGIGLLFTTLVLHVFRVQELPLVELTPVLFGLLLVYGMIYRSARNI